MKRRELTDLQLWQWILVDDARAWDELVDRYTMLVYAFCRQAGLGEADTADVFQHTWLALYEHRFQIQDPGRLSSWLITTAKREAVRLRQRQARLQSDDCLASEADSRPMPDKDLELLELQAMLETALARIDQPCSKLLYAFFFADEDQSYEDIAADLALSPNTLGAKRRRCLNRLKEILIGLGYIEERK